MENWREFGPIVDGVTKRRNIKGRILCVLWPPRLVKIDDGITGMQCSNKTYSVDRCGGGGDRWWLTTWRRALWGVRCQRDL